MISIAVKSGPHPCVVCKAVVETSRAAGKTQALQLGLLLLSLVELQKLVKRHFLGCFIINRLQYLHTCT